MRTVYSPAIGRIDYHYKGNRTGDHRPEGMFIAVGPGIEPRLLDRRIPVTHFGPTIASLLGVTLSDTEGEPIAELVAPANRAARSASLAAL